MRACVLGPGCAKGCTAAGVIAPLAEVPLDGEQSKKVFANSPKIQMLLLHPLNSPGVLASEQRFVARVRYERLDR